ncbi:Aldo/keto reductase [Rickenella mellea]|uniref:Aldo/keto reductase n=1 Tax=Rickenella mellea TaxID=50990 RepID=A0A4Y7PI29_9AGAM|nr:Aldo/keto reductase [Rickenella mellea]
MVSHKVPTRQLGRNGPKVSAIGLGTMGMGAFYGKTDNDEAFETLTYAADRGMTFWDCADIYGDAETKIGEWLKKTGRRSEIFLASKFGSVDIRTNVLDPTNPPISTPSYIKFAFNRTMKNLGVEYLDLYYQHRVDPKVPIEVVLESLREFVDSGKVHWIGLSECSAATLRRAKAVPGVGDKVIAVQMEYSPFSLDIEKSGFVKVAEELGVAVVAYSPLGRGLVSGRYRSRADFDADDVRLWLPRFTEENFPKNLVLTDMIKSIGERYHSSSSQITLAWILASYSYMFPIPGSRGIKRVEENAGGADIKITEEDVLAIRKLSEEADVGGERYPEMIMKTMEGNCIPLAEWKGE